MLKRESIVRELQDRLNKLKTSGELKTVARNPDKEPNVDDMNRANIFELTDVIVKESKRGGKPVYIRRLDLVMELWVESDSDPETSPDVTDLWEAVRSKVFNGGNDLGGLCEINEAGSSRIYRPGVGDHIGGIGISFRVDYTEEV